MSPDVDADTTLHSTVMGAGRCFLIVIGTLAGASIGHTVGVLTGSSPALFEGLFGGLALAALLYYEFTSRDRTGSRRLNIPDTEIPDEIANNDFMTVISNPPDGPGVGVWNRETGAEVFTFTSDGFVEEVWLTDDDEIEGVIEKLKTAKRSGGEK